MKANKIGHDKNGTRGPGASMAAAKASKSGKVWKTLDAAAEYIGWNTDAARSKLNTQKHNAATRKTLENKKRASTPPKPRLRPASGKKK